MQYRKCFVITLCVLITITIILLLNNQSNRVQIFPNKMNEQTPKILYESDQPAETLRVLKEELPCKSKEYKFEIIQHGEFWILKNFVRAEHGDLHCYDTITYTTHGDYTFVHNLIPLTER